MNLPDLTFENTDKVFPAIQYQDGWVWVEKSEVMPFSSFKLADYVTKAIAQSPSLNLEGVPVVDVEEQLIEKGLDRLRMADELLMKYNPKWSTDDEYKIILNLISTSYLCFGSYKAAQSKGTFTEEQLMAVVDFSQENVFVTKVDRDIRVHEFLQSIRPKIVVATEYVKDELVTYYYRPLTEIKNGRVYFKIKQ